jgi:hypothetical protein
MKINIEELCKEIESGKIEGDLNLANNDIGDEGAKVLAEALKVNKSITSVNLENNKIGDEGAKELAEAFKSENCKVTSVNLGVNNIGDDGAKELAEAFKNENCKVTSVNLRFNQIGDEGAKELAKAFKSENCKVTSVNLRFNNKIGDDGAKELAEAFKNENCKVTSVDLGVNNIEDEGAKALMSVIDYYINQNIPNKITINLYRVEKYVGFIESGCVEILKSNPTIYKHMISKINEYDHIEKFITEHANSIAHIIAQHHSDDLETMKTLLSLTDTKGIALVDINKQIGEHGLGYYFSNKPEMLHWLFAHGYIPKGDEYANKEHKLSDIKGGQTVHDPRINDANNFYIKTLKQESDYKPDPADAVKLLNSIKGYSGFVSAFSKKLPFDFLSLEYIKQALTDKESLQHTKNFLEGKTSEQTVARIVEIVLKALHDKYLKVGANYDDYSHQYDYSDQKYKVTLKELILQVYNCTLNRVLPNEEVRGVLVDTIKHNIADQKVLELIGLENYTDNESLYTAVNSKTIEKCSKIFETITDVSLKEYISHKDLFTMMCQLFKAATTYGENNDACKHGITAQVAQTLYMVDSKYIEKYSKHQAVKTEELNEHNISGIVEKIVESLLSNEDPKFAKELSDFATIGNTNKMPIIVIKAINTGFLEIASEQLPYFKTHMPTAKDYSLLIQSIRVNKLFVDGLSHEFMSNESNEVIPAESYTQLNPFSEAMKELQIKQAVAAALGYVLDGIEFNLTGEVEIQDYT